MAELRHSFVSADKSTQCRLIADQDAGANAGSRDEMAFVARSSLSELVWSPRKGLSVKCTDFSLSKNSLMWCSKAGNMAILSSQNIKGMENENNRSMNEEKLCSKQLPPCPENEIDVTETSSRPSRDSAGIITLSGTKNCEDNQDADGNKNDELMKREKDIYSNSDTHNHADVSKRPFGSTAMQDYALLEDQENETAAISLSSRLDESKTHAAPGEPETGNLPEGLNSSKKGGDKCVQASVSADMASEDSKLKQCNLSKKPMLMQDVQNAELVTAFEGTSGSKFFTKDKQESTAENDIKLSKADDKLLNENACAELGLIVVSSPEDKVRQSPRNIALSAEASLNESHSLKRRKGKEKVHVDAGVDQSILKEDGGSHESVESRNSGQLFTNACKVGKFEPELAIGNKKVKRHQNETPGSASFLGKDSSFVNWVSNIAKGLSNFESVNSPYLAIPARNLHHPHGSGDSHSMSHDVVKNVVGRSTGYQNFFQALHCPGGRSQKEIKCNQDQQSDTEVSRELDKVDKMPWDIVARANSSSNENYEVHKFINVGMPAPQMISTAVIALDDANRNNLCNRASKDMARVGESSFCCINHSSSVEKEAIVHGPSGPEVNRNPLDNLWITRFCSKVSTPISNSEHYCQDKVKTIRALKNCDRFLTLSENLIASNTNINKLVDAHEPFEKDQTKAASKSLQHSLLSINSSCGSIGTKAQADCDWKLKAKLNPILTSQKLISSEAMTSLFARRLDALKHITSSKGEDNASPATSLCFYCGKKGHFLRDCPEMNEPELKDLFKDANLYDSYVETSCLCIRCFQFSHWAIACPYSSSQNQTPVDGSDHFPSVTNYERKRTGPHHTNPLVGNFIVSLGSSLQHTEHMVPADKIKEITSTDGTISDYAIKKGLLGKRHNRSMSQNGVSSRKLEVDASNLKQDQLEDNHVEPCVNKQISSMPKEAFDIIRRLRLSRSDILKWTKSPNFNFCLEGFFLRLRLGKWGGATSYHVACISGACRENSDGKCKLSISVDISGLKCSVDSRYISNHDFSEDELKTWWCAHLKGSGKIPGIEELNMKLVEKEKHGFCNPIL